MGAVDWIHVALVLPIIGINFVIWGTIGAMRGVAELVTATTTRLREHLAPGAGARRAPPSAPPGRIEVSEVAILMAAHNEELVITDAMTSLQRLVQAGQIHVISDASTDCTVELAQAAGVNVIETPTNVGKAGALAFGLEAFDLLSRYRAVTIVDADTRLDERYFEAALPLLDDARTSAVAGCARTRWEGRLGVLGSIIVAHRARIYLLTQLLLKFGQTWGGLSATHIIPGFASTYRSTVLGELEIAAPGLVIEDFNMTFELNHKRLGRVAFSPSVIACTQDPATLSDYRKQIARWCLGLWQTVRRNMPGRPVFTATLALNLLETVVSSLYLVVVLPVLVVVLALAMLWPALATEPALLPITTHFSLLGVVLVVGVGDYLLSCFAAVVERRPIYLIAGLFFLPLRVLDACVGLASIPKAWRTSSTGRWTSPERRAVGGTLSATGPPIEAPRAAAHAK